MSVQFICYLAWSADLRQKGKKGASQQRKKRTIVVGHVVLYRCFTVVSWGDAVLYCFFTDVSGGQKLNK